jgi:ankyrin repeat protein
MPSLDDEFKYIERHDGIEKAYHFLKDCSEDDAIDYLTNTLEFTDDFIQSVLEELIEINDIKNFLILFNKNNSSCDFEDCLIHASRLGRIEMIKYILNKGSTQEVLDQSLVEASYFGSYETANLLIKNGANSTYNESQALINSCEYGFIDIAIMLIGYGADKNKIDTVNIYAWLYIIKKTPDDYLIESPEWLKPFLYSYMKMQTLNCRD